MRTERERHGWSQAETAKRLSDMGIPMHWTTVAKIEKGDRSVRIDEAAGIADLFGVSVDALLGRRARPKADLLYSLRGVLDTAQQASWQLASFERTLREQTDELAAVDVSDGYSELVTDAVNACEALAAAGQVVARVGERPDAGVKRATRAMLRSMLEREDSER